MVAKQALREGPQNTLEKTAHHSGVRGSKELKYLLRLLIPSHPHHCPHHLMCPLGIWGQKLID